MAISKTEAKQLKQLMQAPQWGALDHLIQDLKEKVRENKTSADTEWETIRNCLINEGKERAYSELVQELFTVIQSHE